MAQGQCTSSLSAEQLADYERDGYLILRQIFSPAETERLADEADHLLERRELIDANNIRCRWQNHVETGECLFECFDPVADIGSICRQVAMDNRILDALAAIYGEPARLFKDKLIYKPPGAKGYDLHQDYIGWKDFPRTFVTVLVAIDPASDANGATEVFPGVHQSGYLSPEDGEYHGLPLERVDESQGIRLDLAPGDVGLFGCFTPHRSAPNRSDRWRRQLYLSYNALSDGGERRTAHYDEFHTWLRKKYAEYGKTEVYFR
jgi:ectoine hydroxylase-related dioxygenase (phytanoyl-CoA dioxygenase family)